jgi:hypothetical protein
MSREVRNMTAVRAEAPVREALIRLHPLILTVLRRGKRLDDKTREAIFERTLEWCCDLVRREPSLPVQSIGTSVHTRLRQLMSEPKLALPLGGDGSPGEGDAKADGVPRALREEAEGIMEARVAAIQAFLDSLEDPHARVLRLSVGDGLTDLEVAARTGLGSEQVNGILVDITKRMEYVWLAAAPGFDSPGGPSGDDEAWVFHYIPYVRGKLDPDRTNFTENHAFRYVRAGARLAALQCVVDRIRSGEWKRTAPKAEEAAGRKQRSALPVLGGIAAAVVVGALAAFIVVSSLGNHAFERRGSEMSILQPAEIPPGLSMGGASPHAATLEQAVAAYRAGDYERASEHWQRLYDAGARVPDLGLYLGVSQLLEGRPRRAVETQARQVPPGQAGVPYHFYRAQSLLVLGRVEEAREELRVVLASGESGYKSDAERQLTTLLSPPARE